MVIYGQYKWEVFKRYIEIEAYMMRKIEPIAVDENY